MHIPSHLLGARKDPKWRDMSDYLVHFTSSAATLLSILYAQQVEARRPYGWARKDTRTRARHLSACFSEAPIDQLDRLVKRHGQFGIAFSREYVLSRGGQRVWYLQQEGLQEELFNAFSPLFRTDPDRRDPLWELSPFIDRVMPDYQFDWEREWRVVGGLPFDLSDVQFLIIPVGSSQELFEHPAPGVQTLPANALAFWSDVVAALGDDEDRYIEEFLLSYVDPNDFLPWDDGEYVWLVEGYETEDAIDDLFTGRLPDELRAALANRLNQIAPTWCSRWDVEHYADD